MTTDPPDAGGADLPPPGELPPPHPEEAPHIKAARAYLAELEDLAPVTSTTQREWVANTAGAIESLNELAAELLAGIARIEPNRVAADLLAGVAHLRKITEQLHADTARLERFAGEATRAIETLNQRLAALERERRTDAPQAN